MAGILDQLIRPQKRAVGSRSDQKAMELETARQILAEVFAVKLSEVDEMIENRYQTGTTRSRKEDCCLWPQELWVEG